MTMAESLILHDNGHPHIEDIVTKKLNEYGWVMLLHAPYNLEMSPLDFDRFPKLKEPMGGLVFII